MGREPLAWRGRGFGLETRRTLLMGIVNVTPDSFSDGGEHADEGSAIAHGTRLADEGADLIDVGGESTRPGATPVPAEEEWRRIRGVITALARKVDTPISVDTYKPEVADKAIEAGAKIVNDVRGLRDPAMVRLVARTGAGSVIMHMRGEPSTMQANPTYGDVVAEVASFLRERIDAAIAGGVGRESIVVDPGLGFGKTPTHNTELLRRLPEVRALGRPVLVGASRKSFLAKVHPKEDRRRLEASLAAAAFAVERGADLLRVHDIWETVRFVRMLDALAGRAEGEAAPQNL